MSLAHQAQQIFEQAVELSADERDAFLREVCGEDHELLAEVRSLLKHATDTLNDDITPTLDSGSHKRDSDELADQVIVGRYTLKSKLGEGGFGVVYLAQQYEPVKRQVAIKIIKLGMDSKAIVSRFEAERQALALMDHPGVASIIDGGSTEQGRPYFVMEYVKGSPINSFCDEHRMGLQDRIVLFQQLCRAVQHAHSKGIIHRDLKPSNVLVTDTEDGPRLTVIDFGIAKALEARMDDATFFTEAGQFVGTPEYMSPEQFDTGTLDVDTRSDVYALGVIFYELLSGELPFNPKKLRSSGLAGIQKMVQEIEPPKPSTRYVQLRSSGSDTATGIASARDLSISSLPRRLQGDLDWIVMRCLEKDRDRRYETASALSADLSRHLTNQPVEAGPPSARYRLRKFARRRAGTLIAAASIAVILIAGAVVSITFGVEANRQRALAVEQRDLAEQEKSRAKQEQERADAVKDFLTEMLASADPATAGSMDTTLMKLILTDADKSADEAFAGTPLIRAELHTVIGSTYLSLGQHDEAADNFSKALDIRKVLLATDHEYTLSAMNNLAVVRRLQGNYHEAESIAKQVLDIKRRTIGSSHPDMIIALGTYGSVLADQGKRTEAEACYRESLNLCMELLAEDHVDTLYALSNLGLNLTDQSRHSEAEPYLQAAAKKSREILGPEHPETAVYIGNLAFLYGHQGKLPQSEKLFRELIDIDKRVLGEEHPSTAISIDNLGSILAQQGKLDESKIYHEIALNIRRKVMGDEHPHTLFSISNMGYVLYAQGNFHEAEIYQREALDARRRLLGDDHPDTLTSIGNMASLCSAQGHHEKAMPYYQEALDTRRRVLGNNHRDTLIAMSNMAGVLQDQGKFTEAEQLYNEAITLSRKSLGTDHPVTLRSEHKLGSLFHDMKRYDEAEAIYKQTLNARREVLGNQHPDTLVSVNSLGLLLYDQGQYEAAEPYFREAVEGDRALYGDTHPDTLTTINNLKSTLNKLGKIDQAKKYQDLLDAAPAAAPAGDPE